ncbi:hypothetical protein [Anthocerotibacter panamensis]|uniref:hypothetical protein n=1 Tax=Anthocerotibacter panamensis TaxID=2857077 RepID=UPI001C401F23|nr:hypothetical protein [Anthocerotibacter panamensis]
MRSTLVHLYLLPLLAASLGGQALRAEEPVRITGMSVRTESGRQILELDHQGMFALSALFVPVRGTCCRWRIVLPHTVLAMSAPDHPIGGPAQINLTSEGQSVALEVTSNTPPLALIRGDGSLGFDLGSQPILLQAQQEPPAVSPVPAAAKPEKRAVAASSTSAVAVQRSALDPVSFDSSLLLSDQPTLDLSTLVYSESNETPEYNPSPLEFIERRTQGLESALLLKSGEFVQTQNFRLFTPNSPTVDIEKGPSNTYAYGLTDGIELTADLQGQDNNGPGAAGPFVEQRFARQLGATSNTFQEYTLQAKFRLSDAEDFKTALIFSGTVGTRAFSFSTPNGQTELFERSYGQSLIPVVELPLTWRLGSDLAVTVNPKVAFLPQDNAAFVAANPLLGGSFGTLGAVGFGATWRLSEHFQVRGDITPVLFGNNSLNAATGLPAATTVYNAGLRYLVNPRLALDVFATNSYGNTGVGSLVARAGTPGLGLSLTIVPDRFFVFSLPANQKFDKAFDVSIAENLRQAFVRGGFNFLDGGTVPEGQNYIQLKGTSNGFLASVRTGSLDDFETGFYANFNNGADESEAGFSTKIRFTNQAAGDPFTVSGLVTLGRTSDRYLNYVRADRNAVNTHGDPFNAGVGDRGPIPANLFGLFTERLGEVLIATLSLPVERAEENYNLWVIPKISFVQRAAQLGSDEVNLAGVSIGGSFHLNRSLDLIGEVTPLFRGQNALVGSQRERRLAWNAGLRWTFDSGNAAVPAFDRTASLDFYVTNTVGLSPYQSLRVISDNGISVGAGINFPFKLPF